jgi:Uma2 family endonuclease
MSLALRTTYEPWMSAERFIAWAGDGTGRRFQLADGEPVAMAPASQVHARLQLRLGTRLNNHLAAHRPECEAMTEPGVQPIVDPEHNVRVPDLAVGCGPPEAHLLPAPVLIAEILSPSNVRETMESVRACLTIPSLREVVVLSSVAVAAEVYRRGPDGTWPEEPLRCGPGDALRLDSLGFACAMDELYAALGLT